MFGCEKVHRIINARGTIISVPSHTLHLQTNLFLVQCALCFMKNEIDSTYSSQHMANGGIHLSIWQTEGLTLSRLETPHLEKEGWGANTSGLCIILLVGLFARA